jgi:hypothetical protein
MNPFDRARNLTRTRGREIIGGGIARQIQSDAQLANNPAGIVQQPRGLTYTFNVTLVSQLAFPVDFNRLFLFVQNNDPLGVAWLSFGGNAVIGTGIKLAAGGGGILLDNNVPTAGIYLIGTIASNQNITFIFG